METEIKNMQVYVQRMRKSLLDKLFFLDKTYAPVKAVIDFGCANGVLIHEMHEFFPEYTYIGYDINQDMILQAKSLVPGSAFFDNWNELMEYLKENSIQADDVLINASSVIHEVYSYGTDQTISEFYQRIFNSGFHYIATRDMMLNGFLKNVEADTDALMTVRKKYRKQADSFEEVWGPIQSQYALTHLLLKYRYTENWDREVKENYVPVTKEQYLENADAFPYHIVYSEHIAPPYIHQSIIHDTGINLKTATHLKVLFEINEGGEKP